MLHTLENAETYNFLRTEMLIFLNQDIASQKHDFQKKTHERHSKPPKKTLSLPLFLTDF